jgi:hypothetical protein
VAEVGPHHISARLLRLYVEELPDGLRTQKTGDEALRYYLQALIDRRLLLLEARSRGLDATTTFQNSVQDAVNARVRSIYKSQKIASKVKISNEAVRRHFEQEGYGRERLLNAIKVGSRTAIDTVLQELRAGRPFEEVAQARSLDERSAERGGELGFIGRDQLESLHIPPVVFKTLPRDQLSEPLPAGSAWHILRFSEDRSASYEKYQARIASLLYQKRLAQVEAEHLEQLRDSFKVRLNPSALRELVNAYQARQPARIEGNSTALYTYNDGEITLRQVQEFLRQRNISFGLADSAQAVVTLERYFLEAHLIQEAARKDGFYQTPETQKFVERTANANLLEIVRKSVIADLIDLSEEDVRHYYDTHLETFRHSEAIWIEEVLLPTQADALQVKAQIEAGAPFDQFVYKSVRADAEKYNGRYHFHMLGKARYPVLVPAVFQAQQGQLEGPLQVEGGYSVFRVLEREESSIEPFETVQRRARALLRLERETQALNAFLVQLRGEYADQVKIYPDRLKEAVPDSLLLAQN